MSDRHDKVRWRLLTRGSWSEAKRFAGILREETVGGVLLLLAAGRWAVRVGQFAVVARLRGDVRRSRWAPNRCICTCPPRHGRPMACWRSSSSSSDLSWSGSSSQAICAIRRQGRAADPGGGGAACWCPASSVRGDQPGRRPPARDLVGWAVPTATDIAFALAVLAVLSTHLPTALRTQVLLTLAVVDDLLAIIVIAVFYTDHLSPRAAGAGADPRRPVRAGRAARASAAGGCWCRWPSPRRGAGARQRCALHRRGRAAGLHGAGGGQARVGPRGFEHILRPLSAGFAVPVFAFFAAGVTVGGWAGFGQAVGASGHARGVIVGLVLGKPLGVFGHRVPAGQIHRREPRRQPRWLDVLGVSLLGGHRLYRVVIDR